MSSCSVKCCCRVFHDTVDYTMRLSRRPKESNQGCAVDSESSTDISEIFCRGRIVHGPGYLAKSRVIPKERRTLMAPCRLIGTVAVDAGPVRGKIGEARICATWQGNTSCQLASFRVPDTDCSVHVSFQRLAQGRNRKTSRQVDLPIQDEEIFTARLLPCPTSSLCHRILPVMASTQDNRSY